MEREPDGDGLRGPVESRATAYDQSSGSPEKRENNRSGLAALLQRERAKLPHRTGDQYKRLLSRMPAVVCELAPDGTVLFVNGGAARITGYQPAELQGRNWWDVFCLGELRQKRDDLLQRLRKGDVSEYEMALRTRDGSLKTLAWDFASQYAPDGTLESVVGTGIDITEHKLADDRLRESWEQLQGAIEGTIQAMAMTVEIRDPYTAGHQRRVATLSCAIAREMGLPEDQIAVLRLAAIVHDIGKISVPAEILNKPGKISETELELIRAHPQVGYAILKTIPFPWPIAEIEYQHHERLNGSGYPLGLSGDGILPEARILGVADVVESIAGYRPYRPALGMGKAIKEITKFRGVLYEAKVVDACLKVIKRKGFDWEE